MSRAPVDTVAGSAEGSAADGVACSTAGGAADCIARPARRGGRQWVRLALLVALAFAARVWVQQERVSAGHGDVADAVAVARQLVAGHGFVVDHVGSHLVPASGLPTPACVWWQPGPAVLAALGMWVAGDDGFVPARLAASLLSALLVSVCFLLARELSPRPVVAWAAAWLALGWPPFLGQACLPLSQGCVALWGGLTACALLASRRRPAWLLAVGASAALASLCRGDGLLWWPTVVLAVLSRAPRGRQLAAFGLGLALFALLCAPWWWRNQQVLGRVVSPAQTSMLLARTPGDFLSARPETLTLTRLAELGRAELAAQRGQAVARNLWHAVSAPVAAVPSRPEGLLAAGGLTALAWVLVGLSLLGVRGLLRGGGGPLLLHAMLLVLFYGVLFPTLALESFPVGWFALLPAVVVAAALGLARMGAWLPLGSQRAPVVAALVLALLAVVLERPVQGQVGREIERMLADHRAFGAWYRQHGAPDMRVYVLHPWEFTLESGVPSVLLPLEGPAVLSDVARRLGVTHVAHLPGWGPLEQLRPGLARLAEAGRLVTVGTAGPFDLYELRLRR